MDSWQSRLQERRTQFLQRTKERLQTIHELLASLKETPSDVQAVKSLNRLYHQMAGAGGIYEMTELCDLTIAAEEICTRLMREQALMNEIDYDKLMMLTNSLAAVVDGGGQTKTTPVEEAVKNTDCTPRFDVLIAHHNNETLIALHKAFDEQKFRVRTVKSGSGARGACLTRLPDALIVSIPLPDSPGYDVVEQLRAMPEGHRPSICLVGEHATFRYKVDGIRAGADAFLEEPVDAAAVVAKVKALLTRDRTEGYKILSVEDDPEQASFIKSTLESVGYSVQHIADPALFEDTLISFAPDLVLLDIMLGEMNGHELARFVRQDERFATTPIIFLTTENQLNAHIESARVGGDDHLIKPIPPQLLVAAIAGRLERYSLLKRLIGRDGATQFLTYATFIDHAQRFCANTKKVAGGAVLVQFDIDRMDMINERYGNAAGEKVIAGLASLIRNTFRQFEIIGRIGGDDFAVVVEGLTPDEAKQLTTRVLETLASTPQFLASHPVTVTARAGIAGLTPEMTVRTWLSRAAGAVEAARNDGGNCVVMAELAAASSSAGPGRE